MAEELENLDDQGIVRWIAFDHREDESLQMQLGCRQIGHERRCFVEAYGRIRVMSEYVGDARAIQPYGAGR